MLPSSVWQYLNSFINHELHLQHVQSQDFKLERVHKILAELHSPHQSLKFIHVAGTKGKGSVCAMVSSILAAAGFKVGLYTSPHLYEVTERIRVLNSSDQNQKDQNFLSGQITESQLKEILTELFPLLEKFREKEPLSFFEVLTIVSIVFFFKQNVDWVVWETGLGGRLDATNVVDSEVAVITSISLDHCRQLGSTLKEIAKEKVAIVKRKRQPVVVALQELEAQRVIEQHLKELEADATFVGRDIQYVLVNRNLHQQRFDIKTPHTTYKELSLKLLGDHQLMNAAVSIGVIEALNRHQMKIDETVIKKGFASCSWPGRFEIFGQEPVFVFDGAHNQASIAALVKTLKSFFPGKNIDVILGVSIDKDIPAMLSELNQLPLSRIIFTCANHPRAARLSKEELKMFFRNQEIVLTTTVQEALRIALKPQRDNSNDEGIKKGAEVVVITGSLFVVGEARRLCIK